MLLFLDIDGVLNNWDWLQKNKGYIDKTKIELLNQLKDLNIKIVISSSWGEDGIKPLKDCGLILPIIGFIDHYKSPYLNRGQEIEMWIKNNKPNEDYIILDDDSDFTEQQMKNNYVEVDGLIGLTQEIISKIKEKIKNE